MAIQGGEKIKNRGEIFIIVSILSDICYFYKYMKNKIGILENDIYIFPI